MCEPALPNQGSAKHLSRFRAKSRVILYNELKTPRKKISRLPTKYSRDFSRELASTGSKQLFIYNQVYLQLNAQYLVFRAGIAQSV